MTLMGLWGHLEKRRATTMSHGALMGRQQVRQFYAHLLQALPDLHIDVQRRHAAQDTVVLEVIIRGRHCAEPGADFPLRVARSAFHSAEFTPSTRTIVWPARKSITTVPPCSSSWAFFTNPRAYVAASLLYFPIPSPSRASSRAESSGLAMRARLEPRAWRGCMSLLPHAVRASITAAEKPARA